MKKYSEKYIFESMPVPRAVATLAIPTMISQGLLNIPLLIRYDMDSAGSGGDHVAGILGHVFPYVESAQAAAGRRNRKQMKGNKKEGHKLKSRRFRGFWAYMFFAAVEHR